MEGKGGFHEKGWKEAALALLPASERQKNEKGKKKGNGDGKSSGPKNLSSRRNTGSKNSAWQQSGSRQDWTSLVKFLEREGLMPTVVFSFSKKVMLSMKCVCFFLLLTQD